MRGEGVWDEVLGGREWVVWGWGNEGAAGGESGGRGKGGGGEGEEGDGGLGEGRGWGGLGRE